jgi:hypothetical protein
MNMNEPFFKSYLLGRNFLLEDVKDLSDAELNTLNIETMAALEEARYQYARVEDKTTAEAGPVFARMKIAGYFQAAIKLELEPDD